MGYPLRQSEVDRRRKQFLSGDIQHSLPCKLTPKFLGLFVIGGQSEGSAQVRSSIGGDTQDLIDRFLEFWMPAEVLVGLNR